MNNQKDKNSEDALNFSEKLSKEFLREMRLKRRWGIFFKLSFLVIIISFLFIGQLSNLKYAPEEFTGPVIGLVRIDGVIGNNVGVDYDTVSKSFKRAFKNPRLAGFIILINSPGGTPVQSSLINQLVWEYREKYPDTKIIAVVEDICASGGYYIASAAEEIYADASSLVGSIGVRLDSFGFEKAMEKLGVERRLFVAGQKKALLDPFSPLTTDDKKVTEELLADLHKTFINAVMKGRKDKLKSSQVFSGLVWTGRKSLELGLIDGLGSYKAVSEKVFSANNIVDYTEKSFALQRAFEGLKGGISNLFSNERAYLIY